MPELEDLIPNIWLNLAIKSTVRFRCVSKSWCASLSEPQFIYKNLTAANEHDLILLTDLKRPHYSLVSHETLMASPLQEPPLLEVPPPPPNIPDRIHPRCYDIDVLSPPCHDLVCFNFNEDRVIRSMGVWNLTAGETKMVPPLVVIDEMSFTPLITFGFGFDEKRKEYKIVQVLYNSHFSAAYVYGLSSNCWRKIGDPKMMYRLSYEPHVGYSRSYRDGTFYWGSKDLIMSFDMSSEVFKPISISLAVRSSVREICKLKEGSMLVIASEYPKRSEYEIWAVLEVGATQSWTKLVVVDWFCEHEVLYGIWRNELILGSYSESGLLVSDPFKREIKKIHIDEPKKIKRCLRWTKVNNKSLLNF